LVLPVALSLAVALVVPTTAFAANSTTGYNQTPPSAGTSPSKEKSAPAKAPAKEVAPATKSSVPTTTKSTKASTLPFTGFDLRWTVGIGLLLMGMGFLIVMVQRRQRRSTGR
jgi:cytoskeletal protein RodZ